MNLCFIWPKVVSSQFLKCCETVIGDSPVHVLKNHFLMADAHVSLDGYLQDPCKYLNKYLMFVVDRMLLSWRTLFTTLCL